MVLVVLTLKKIFLLNIGSDSEEGGNIIEIGNKRFSFECIFDDKISQRNIYDKCIKELVDGCFKGYNATVFACKL